MDSETTVCVTKQESPGLIECDHYGVDSMASTSTPGSAAPPLHDMFASNPAPITAFTEQSKTEASIEGCSPSLEMEDLDETPSPDDEVLQPKHDSGITLILENAELWQKFREVHTEMIITKSGRRMFPCFSVAAIGLVMEQKYAMKLVFKSDDKRYKYVNSKWAISGKAESHNEEYLSYKHPDSGSTGKNWSYNKISFKKVKLTNCKTPKKGQISLNSMHRYTPCVIVSKYLSKKSAEIVHVQDFPQATFYAVTAYQNDQVTQLKIDNNPFAKAFRESPIDKDGSSSYGGLQPAGWSNSSSSLTSRWPVPAPLLSPSCSPISPALISPRWPPASPLINPFNATEFTQVTFSPISPGTVAAGTQQQSTALPQFTSVFGTSSNPYAIYRPPTLSALPTYQPSFSTANGVVSNSTD